MDTWTNVKQLFFISFQHTHTHTRTQTQAMSAPITAVLKTLAIR